MGAPRTGSLIHILQAARTDFSRNDCGTRAAALAYATVFALPPLLILLVIIAGRLWDPGEVQRALEYQFAGMVGADGARQIHDMMVHGFQSPGNGLVATLVSVVGLLLGAIGALLALQGALNLVWQVKPDPKHGGIKHFITKRLLSLGMVVGLGFLLAVSLAITAAITAFGSTIIVSVPDAAKYAFDLVLSTAVLGVLFAAVFKVLPDADIEWKDVWVGGVATAVFFVIGKYLIGLYLGHSKPGDAFGAAGALAVVLVWAYYAGMIVLFGAEFTQEWATQRGGGIRPSPGAVRAVKQEVVS
ncbi:MAG: ribonuclease [Gemmatimonadetes bacterium]|nr:ribonuclease [Gemmatimonadota bacterium]